MIINKVTINNFLSIKSSVINIDDLQNSLVLVTGVNHDSFSSNGSGKSSVFDAIIYGIYGKSSRSVQNIYTSDPVEVIVDITHKSNSYRIIRTTGNVEVTRNNEMMTSASTVTASQKLIDDELMTYDEFIKLFRISTNDILFSSMSHQNRRNYLLSVFNIDEYVSKYESEVDRLSKKSNSLKLKLLEVKSNYEGSSNYISKSLYELSNKLDKAKLTTSESPEGVDKSINKIKSDIESLSVVLDNNVTTKSTIDKEDSKLSLSLSIKKQELVVMNNNIESYGNKVCPTCHQKYELDEADYNALINTRNLLSKEVEDINNQYKSIVEYSNKYYQVILEQKSVLSKLNLELSSLYDLRSKIVDDNTSVDIENYKRLSLELEDVNKLLKVFNDEYNLFNDNYYKYHEYLSRNKSLFINNILEKSTNLLNSRLEINSSKVLPYKVLVSIDKKQVNIIYNDKNIETLSSGERRRVDLVIALTLRDMYADKFGISVNMLVLDEVLDTIDDISSIIDLLVSNLSSNIFLVSHNKSHNSSYDYVLNVEKKDNLSTAVLEVHNG